MKILYLYTEIMGYQIPVFRELMEEYDAEIFVVHWDREKLTPFCPPDIPGLTFFNRSEYFRYKDILKLALSINPDLVYISGWQDKAYLKVVKCLKLKAIPIVIGFDDQWFGSIRQVIGSILMRFTWIRKYFTYAWVAGPLQFEYALRMGFKRHQIIMNLLTCDFDVFGVDVTNSKKSREFDTLKYFMYVGRFHRNKGLDILLTAYQKYKKNTLRGWRLVCIGGDALTLGGNEIDGLELIPFQSASKLMDYVEHAGAFVLPSIHEPWGVAVQEFALAGLPLILSENVGSHPVFLIDGYNGYLFKNNSADDLAEKMYLISQKNDKELSVMGARSRGLGLSITPQMSAASLMSVLEQ